MVITIRELVAVLITGATIAGVAGGVIGSELHQGPTGPIGPQGVEGVQGPPGPAVMSCADPVVGTTNNANARMNLTVKVGLQAFPALLDTGAGTAQYLPDTALRAAGYRPVRTTTVGGMVVGAVSPVLSVYSIPVSAIQVLTGQGHYRSIDTSNVRVSVVGTQGEVSLISPAMLDVSMSVTGGGWKLC